MCIRDRVVDDLTFIIHMNQPSNALLTSLAHAGGAILCKSYTEKLEMCIRDSVNVGNFHVADGFEVMNVQISKLHKRLLKENETRLQIKMCIRDRCRTLEKVC